MSRIKRTNVGGYVYHVLNRAKASTHFKDYWLYNTVKKFGLEQTLRREGRSKNSGWPQLSSIIEKVKEFCKKY